MILSPIEYSNIFISGKGKETYWTSIPAFFTWGTSLMTLGNRSPDSLYPSISEPLSFQYLAFFKKFVAFPFRLTPPQRVTIS